MVVSYAATGLNRRRVDTRNVHILLDNDAIGLGLGKCSICPGTVTCFPMVNLVGRLLILLVGTQQWRIGVKGLFGVDKHRQRLVIDVDGSYTISGSIATGSDDEGDFLHLEMHT